MTIHDRFDCQTDDEMSLIAEAMAEGGKALSQTESYRVSPARAGMDPGIDTDAHPRGGFPRTRGDGPVMSGYRLVVSEFPPHARGWTRNQSIGCHRRQVPPHARGWTRRMLRLRRWVRVSPARAWMDQRDLTNPQGRPGFPRTRGDGPA